MKNFVITGAGDSVGRIIAERCVNNGHRVHICDISESAVTNTISENKNGMLRGTVADVSVAKDVEKLFHDALEWMDGIDILVNIAALGGPRACVEDINYDEWHDVVNVNLSGAFYCAKQVVPVMKQQKHGVIINFSSCSAKLAPPLRTPYVASKAAIEALTRCLARELGPHNIRCNAIVPGAINNQRLNAVLQRNASARGIGVEEMKKEMLGYVSLRRVIEMNEFADLVLFLSSLEAAGITGQVIELGGNVEWEDS